MSQSFPPLAHLRCALTPLVACAYVTVVPAGLGWALVFALIPFALDLGASRGAEERRQPRGALAKGWFNALLAGLFAVHWITLAAAGLRFSTETPVSAEGAVATLLCALSTSLIAGAVGHELIHRRGAGAKLAGRVLLASMAYEHLYTEHLRGHHARVGTAEDPTTARLGESLWAYWARAIPGQLASAWRLERQRLAGRGVLIGTLGNRVLQGVALELALLCMAWLAFGWGGVGVLALQALIANLLFQVVNYFQHWGVRRDLASGEGLSWDTPNASTLFSMVGLARHGDHHRHPARPFQELHHLEASNTLPGSYGRVIGLAVFRNRRFQELMLEELARRERLPLDYQRAPSKAVASASAT